MMYMLKRYGPKKVEKTSPMWYHEFTTNHETRNTKD